MQFWAHLESFPPAGDSKAAFSLLLPFCPQSGRRRIFQLWKIRLFLHKKRFDFGF